MFYLIDLPARLSSVSSHWVESVTPIMQALRCERNSSLLQAEEQAVWSHHTASWGADCLGSSGEAEPAGPLVPKAEHHSPEEERMSRKMVIGSAWQKSDSNLKRGDRIKSQRKLFWVQFWELKALTKIQAVQLLDFCNIWENLNMVWFVWFENWLNAIRMENLQHLY